MTAHEIKNQIGYSKYSSIYISIIEKALSEDRLKLNKTNPSYIYYEAHHILPKAKKMFPEYSSFKKHPWNKVLLTAREHFICHLLLAKHYKSISNKLFEIKMNNTVKLMKTRKNYTSKLYQYFKTNNCFTEETRQKLKDAHKNRSDEETKLIRKKAIKTYKETLANKPKEEIELKNKRIGIANSGSKSSSALKIGIYDSEGNLKHVCNGNFKGVCNNNKLPHGHLKKSYQLNGKPIYENIVRKCNLTKVINSGNYIYKGWYAKKI